MDLYHYNDTGSDDVFSREPFVALWATSIADRFVNVSFSGAFGREWFDVRMVTSTVDVTMGC